MTDHLVALNGEATGTDIGGKAAALDRLIALGLRVPHAVALDADAYRCATDGPLHDTIGRWRSEVPDDPAGHEHRREAVDAAFARAAVPEAVATALARVVDELGPGPYAVRSSATAEDMDDASFAGQYESIIGVEPDQLGDAVKAVWASLWHPAPRLYRRRLGMDDDEVAMAVLIMDMIHAERAGVLFTADPGDPDRARLEIVEGQGEQLVSGDVTPEAHVVDRDDLAAELGAIAPELRDLGAGALAIEEAFGVPMDIEYAVADGAVWFLQARPITTTALGGAGGADLDDGFDVSCGEATTYTTAGIAEMLPGVLSPLSWTLNSWCIENGFRSLFDVLGGDARTLTREHVLLGRFRGRAVLNLDAMRTAASSIPGGSARDLEEQYFGASTVGGGTDAADDGSDAAGGSDAGPGHIGSLVQSTRVLRARRAATQRAVTINAAVDRLIASEPALGDLDDSDLVAYWNRLLHTAQLVVSAEIAVAAMAAAAYSSLESFLGRYLGDADAAEAAQRLTRNDGRDRRARISMAIEPVVERLRSDGELRSVVGEDWATSRAALERSAAGRELLAQFRHCLRRAGSTRIMGGAAWNEVPHLAWMTVDQELGKPSPTDAHETRREALADLEQELRRAPTWRLARLVSNQVVDVRLRYLRREADDAASLLLLRERTKASLLVCGGSVRRCALEIGERLAARGSLDDAHDVELLAVFGLAPALLAGDVPDPDVLDHRRRAATAAERAGPLPRVFDGTPANARPLDAVGDSIEGWAASPGRYEGQVGVITNPGTDRLTRGDVLVATSTDASWAPLFMRAGAVVVERGGPLSHAAIVARELGIPAVTNVEGLVQRLADVPDATVIVDGTAGTVTILDADRPDGETGAGGREANSTGAGTGNGSGVDGAGDTRTMAAAPIAPQRPLAAAWDDTAQRMGVFVAGLMGAGALMSVVAGLAQPVSSERSRTKMARRGEVRGLAIACGVLDGWDSVARSATGLRSRAGYAVIAAGLALAAAVVAGIGWSGAEDGVDDIGWALGLAGAANIAVAAVVVAVAVARHPDVPAAVRRSLPATRLDPPPPPPATVVGVVAVVGFALATLLATFADGWLDRVDRVVQQDWLGITADTGRIGPEWLVILGRPEWIIPLAVVAGAAAWRNRRLAIAFPLAVVAAGVTNRALGAMIARSRPETSIHVGEMDSFPGGHALQSTLILGALPLVVATATRRRWTGVVAAAVVAPVLAVVLTDAVRTGGHWPSDQLAGFLLGVALVTALHRAADPDP
ncbi:MAG: PEP/pyruvate-binding domain-containing protein [Acidimicrobiales bacterium]